MKKHKEPENHYEALVLALRLALIAPTEAKKKECSDIAEGLASQMTELEVARAKKEALEQVADETN